MRKIESESDPNPYGLGWIQFRVGLNRIRWPLLCSKLIKADEAQISAENNETDVDTEHEDSVIGMNMFDKNFENDLLDVSEDPAK